VKKGEEVVGILGEKIEGHRKKEVQRKAYDLTTAAVLWCPKPGQKQPEPMGV